MKITKEWNSEAYNLRYNNTWVPCVLVGTGQVYQLYVTGIDSSSMKVTGFGPAGWVSNSTFSLNEIHPVYIQLPPVYWPILEHESFKFKDDQIKNAVTIRRLIKNFQQGISQSTYKIWNPQIKVVDASKVVPKFCENGKLIEPYSLIYDVDKALGSFGPISPEMCFWNGRLYFLDSVIGLFNKSMTKITVLPNYIQEVEECLSPLKISVARF